MNDDDDQWYADEAQHIQEQAQQEAEADDLSAAAKAARRPLPPADLVDAQQDRVHRDAGRSRTARTVRKDTAMTTDEKLRAICEYFEPTPKGASFNYTDFEEWVSPLGWWHAAHPSYDVRAYPFAEDCATAAAAAGVLMDLLRGKFSTSLYCSRVSGTWTAVASRHTDGKGEHASSPLAALVDAVFEVVLRMKNDEAATGKDVT